MVLIVRQGTFVAGHPHVAPSYTRMYRPSTPGCKRWQHGGVYGIICLFLLNKERAFVKWRTVFRLPIQQYDKTSYWKILMRLPCYFDGKYIVIKDGRSSIFPISFQQKRIPCNHRLQGIVFCLLRSSQRESRWTFFNFITLVLIFTACSPSRGNWSIRTESCKSWCVPGIPHDES